MTFHSESLDQLAAALTKAQAELPTIPKTGTGNYGKFAELTEVVTLCRPILAAHGLAVVQSPSRAADGVATLSTMLLHESGQFIEDEMALAVEKPGPQGQGSGISYARRYAYCAVLGIVADEDDDGQAAQPAQSRGRQTSSRSTGRGQGSSGAAPVPTPAQLAKIAAQFRELGGYADPEDRHQYVAALIGSPKIETKAQASKVIEAQIADLAKRPQEQPAFDGYGPGEEPF